MNYCDIYHYDLIEHMIGVPKDSIDIRTDQPSDIVTLPYEDNINEVASRISKYLYRTYTCKKVYNSGKYHFVNDHDKVYTRKQERYQLEGKKISNSTHISIYYELNVCVIITIPRYALDILSEARDFAAIVEKRQRKQFRDVKNIYAEAL